mgnify:CR=1 FL=1
MADDDLNVSIEVPDELYQRLTAEAKEKNVTVDKLINDMIREAIKSDEFERLVKKYKEEQNVKS